MGHYDPAPKYCRICGGLLGPMPAAPGKPPLLACLGCGRRVHLDPKLAAAALIVENGQALLLRRARPPARGLWCLPGGFVDRGEKVEMAAVREVGEETGLESRTGRLLGLYSYPGYPVVVAIFEMEIIGGELSINDESLEARWFEPSLIPWEELAFPSARDCLLAWAGFNAPAGNR